MSDKKRRIALLFCIKRDGRRCAICGRFISISRAILHHVDNNPSNNPPDGSNWMAVCKRDNYIENPRGSKKQNAFDMSQSSYIHEASSEMRSKERMYPQFCHWLRAYLIKNHCIEYHTFINTIAKKTGGSQITMKRYLDTITYPISLDGWVFLNVDDNNNQTFIYLKTSTMQPIDNGLIDLLEKSNGN